MAATLTAADFSGLRLQYKNTCAEGDALCVIEHDFPGGRMVDHYFVIPGPNFWQDEAIVALGEISGLLFLQQPAGQPWQVLVHEPNMVREVLFEMSEEEFQKMLANSGVTLPG